MHMHIHLPGVSGVVVVVVVKCFRRSWIRYSDARWFQYYTAQCAHMHKCRAESFHILLSDAKCIWRRHAVLIWKLLVALANGTIYNCGCVQERRCEIILKLWKNNGVLFLDKKQDSNSIQMQWIWNERKLRGTKERIKSRALWTFSVVMK